MAHILEMCYRIWTKEEVDEAIQGFEENNNRALKLGIRTVSTKRTNQYEHIFEAIKDLIRQKHRARRKVQKSRQQYDKRRSEPGSLRILEHALQRLMTMALGKDQSPEIWFLESLENYSQPTVTCIPGSMDNKEWLSLTRILHLVILLKTSVKYTPVKVAVKSKRRNWNQSRLHSQP